MILGHVAVAGAAWAWEGESLTLLVLASLGPDLVDKPLNLLGLGASREAGHSLLFFLLLFALGWLLRLKPRRLSFLAGLWLGHLAFDLVDPQTLLWPFLGLEPAQPQPPFFEKILRFYSGHADPRMLVLDLFWLGLAPLVLILRRGRRTKSRAAAVGARSTRGRS